MAKGQTAGLRVRAARGTMVTAAFEVGLQGLGFLKGFVIAAFLTQSEYGIWGILVITIGTLTWLKEIGVSEKFVQQDEEDQERAFQKAFTFDLMTNAALMVLMLALLPVFAVAYDQWDLILPGLLIIATLPAYSLRAPMWIYYRDMRYGRQRALEAADPVTAFVVSVVLAASGVGYWSLVIGLIAGVWAGAIAAMLSSPYRLRLVFDRATAREYFSFSWPLFVANASGLLIPQLSMLAGNAAVGLAGVGAIALAGSVSVWTDKVDQIVTWTLYPAICKVKDRVDLLYEAFVKTNRLTLMWGIPFGVGLALFVDDLVHYVIGSHWSSAVPLVQAFGLIAALNHIGFNWSAFYRARGDTRPLAIVAPIVTATFLVVALPGLFLWGLDGYAIGMAAMALAYLVIRSHYLRKLFPGFRMLPHAARALAPTVPAVAVVFGARLLEGDRTAGLAVGEVVAYVVVTLVATAVFERALLREVLGYLRGRAFADPAEPVAEAVPAVPARA
jgi:O-antigen/teichoic acid export membrane protein